MALPSIPIPSFPLILTEDGGRGRRVVLSGPDLPRDEGPTWHGGGVRGSIRYYAGSDTPTVQIFGPEESNLGFEGMFEDRKKGIPGWAVFQSNQIDQIRHASLPVIYEYGPIRRRCKWQQVQFQMLELGRIRYRIDLEVIDAGFGDGRRVFSTLNDIPGVSTALSAIGKAQAVLDLLPPGVGGEVLSRARTAVGTASAVVGKAGSILGRIQAAGSAVDPRAAAGALSSLQAGRQSLSEAWEHARAFDWRAAAGSTFDGVISVAKSAAQAGGEILRSAVQIDRLIGRVEPLAAQATDDTVYVAAEGETLQRIAHRYYGDAAAWTRIAQANQKADATVRSGEVLLIPGVPRTSKQVAP